MAAPNSSALRMLSFSSHPRAWGSLGITLAFATGILFTLSYYELYDLERRLSRRKRRQQSSSSDLDARAYIPSAVRLEDHTKTSGGGTRSNNEVSRGISSTIGNTPIFELTSLSDICGMPILVKAEYLNGPGNSPKDRVALSMILDAESRSLLTPDQGDTIYEGTSGSTGISLSAIARSKGYKAYICMDTDQSPEKVSLLRHLGATVKLVSPAPITSPDHYVNLARRRATEHEDKLGDGSKGFFTDQFENTANFSAHFTGTGPEIYDQCNGSLLAFVSGSGTGGTISGVASYLKEEVGMKDVQIILADPEGSGLYNKVKYGVMYSGKEKEGTKRRNQVDTIVEGIGINRLTHNFDKGLALIDDAVKVSDEQACIMARWLVEKEGCFVGSSSAVNCVAAVATALKLRSEGMEGKVVTILCDSGTRHTSKFWKKVGEMGLEQGEHEESGLLKLLGLDGAY